MQMWAPGEKISWNHKWQLEDGVMVDAQMTFLLLELLRRLVHAAHTGSNRAQEHTHQGAKRPQQWCQPFPLSFHVCKWEALWPLWRTWWDSSESMHVNPQHLRVLCSCTATVPGSGRRRRRRRHGSCSCQWWQWSSSSSSSHCDSGGSGSSGSNTRSR